MTSTWEITAEVGKLPSLHNPILVEGLPGIGNVGKIAVDFLIDEIKAQKLYSFFSHRFPHSVFVNEQNLVEMPKLEMYYKKFNGGGKRRDLIFLTGDIQPIDEESCYSFCEEVLKILKHFQCSEMVTTGGIGLRTIPERPRVFCTANNAVLLKEYTAKELAVEKQIFGVVGPVVGVSGVLLGLGKKRGINGVSLLAETFAHPMYFGIKGAKEILRVLDAKLQLHMDLKKMHKEIIAVEKDLLKKTNEWLAEMGSTHAGAKAKEHEATYIG